MARHGAAVHLLGEGEAVAAPARLDVDDDIAELAVAARLLLVSAAHRDGILDRLAIGDERLPRLGRHAETRAEPLEREAQMHLALARETQFARLLILGEIERGILVDELGERGREAHLVLAVLHRKGEDLHGLRGRRALEPRGRLLGVGEAISRRDVVEPQEGDRVAGFGPPDLHRARPDQARQACDALFGTARARHGRAVGERSRATRARRTTCRHAPCECCA